jgi:hypothetical protein
MVSGGHTDDEGADASRANASANFALLMSVAMHLDVASGAQETTNAHWEFTCHLAGEVAEPTWDSVFTCTHDQVFLSHSRIAPLSNATPLARRISREAQAT